jgi:hypothetical protein
MARQHSASLSLRPRRAADAFFLRVDEVGETARRCERTLPLFPLVLILAADGTLA